MSLPSGTETLGIDKLSASQNNYNSNLKHTCEFRQLYDLNEVLRKGEAVRTKTSKHEARAD